MLRRKALTVAGLVATIAMSISSPNIAAAQPINGIGSALQSTETFSDSYGVVQDAGFALPAIPIQRVKPEFRRQIVSYESSERPGTIIVNTRERHLYYILSDGKAVRYGIGVGKQGFAWSGTAYVAWKQEWPTWHPPKEMAVRRPDVAKYVEGGMGPGLSNPLGARAMYLFNDKGQDTLFRLHGTPEWASIGTAASSGCIRLMNQDVIDLYNRVRPGRTTSKVIVIQ
ncbi:L,D-transpeptidase [Oryzifoliimicrobium ureilyticus]|uniref:L,D-transpeptidase n=1 Tax=Oryzifoliimicrobium ureilyticus TaxID=3113724 RepID=UPI0030763AFC